MRPEFGGGLIRVLSVGDTFIVESVCRRVESECIRVAGVLPAVVVSRMRSCFCFVESVVITLPFAESTFVESVWMRVDERVVSCGYVVGATWLDSSASSFAHALQPERPQWQRRR